MRILFCNFHEANGGGQDTYLLSLVRILRQQHYVALACPPTSRLYLSLQTTIPCFAINYKALFRKWWLLIGQLKTFRQWIDSHAFDIIHLNGSADHRAILLIYPFLKKKPKLVLTKHNALCIKYGAFLRMRYFTDATIAVSQSTKQHLLHASIPSKLIRMIPNGINITYYKPISVELKKKWRHHFGLPEDAFILVSNAGTATCKNWPSLIAAVAKLPTQLKIKIRIIIAGKMPTQQTQWQTTYKFGLDKQVIFTGLLPDIRQWMQMGDVGFVLSNAEETISFACREMMAMGLPIIVSNYGGLPENISHGADGWIVPVNDIFALTCCLKQLIQSDITTLGNHARDKAVKHFNENHFIKATFNLYEALINASPQPHH